VARTLHNLLRMIDMSMSYPLRKFSFNHVQCKANGIFSPVSFETTRPLKSRSETGLRCSGEGPALFCFAGGFRMTVNIIGYIRQLLLFSQFLWSARS